MTVEEQERRRKKKVNQADKKRAMIHWNQLEIAQRKFFLFEEISKTQLLPNPRGEWQVLLFLAAIVLLL